MSQKHKNDVDFFMNYIDHLLTVISTIAGCGSIYAFLL